MISNDSVSPPSLYDLFMLSRPARRVNSRTDLRRAVGVVVEAPGGQKRAAGSACGRALPERGPSHQHTPLRILRSTMRQTQSLRSLRSLRITAEFAENSEEELRNYRDDGCGAILNTTLDDFPSRSCLLGAR